MDAERERGGGRTVARLIEKATTSTDRDVDPRLLKAIKSAVRSSDDELRAAVDSLMGKMKKEHSQVRYLAVLIIDELFMRSKLFRSLLINNFDHFLSLSIGFRRNMPLPPPSNIASVLREKSIELLEKWHASFGVHYRQLRLGFEYLKNTLRYQFPNRLERAARLHQQRQEREIRSMEILLNKFNNLKENYSSIKAEIQSTLDQLGECLEIVQNKEGIFSFSLEEDESEPEEFTSSTLWQIRQESLREGKKVSENSENSAVFDALREFYKLIVSKHLLSVQEWMSVLVRVDTTDKRFRDFAMKEFIDVRNLIQSARKKCEELGCVLPSSTPLEQEENDMWEEGTIGVPDYDNARLRDASSDNYVAIADKKVQELGDCGSSIDNPDMMDGKSVATLVVDKDGDKGASSEGTSNHESSVPSSLKSKLLTEAPVVKWGPFLESWGSKQDAMVNYRGLELESHWGRVEQDAVIPAEKIAELSSNWCLYEEQTIEIKPCLAPLKNGRLCQRRDLKVCPFHGPIIPRDSNGNPLLETSQRGGKGIVEEHSKDAAQNSAKGNQLTEEDEEKSNCEQVYDSLSVEESPSSGKGLMKQLAEQAVRNVRERDKEVRTSKRARLAKVREHNEAVLRKAAYTSTPLSSTFTEEGTSSDPMLPKVQKPSLSSMLRKKVTAKDRLTHRLLKTRVTDAAAKQLMQAEDANYREAYPNQW
ncbi:hypothetical protein Taro_013406 [Colocasia esculenta]|uniref:UV-stimulated scaffold protein A C-terminal domain-containing protein n=1 Tax=Colocasia esculenta TaxID=4460 RepID=A0A843U6G2_COLES|nr:hypothetical protein [Colocasia esculenta]